MDPHVLGVWQSPENRYRWTVISPLKPAQRTIVTLLRSYAQSLETGRLHTDKIQAEMQVSLKVRVDATEVSILSKPLRKVQGLITSFPLDAGKAHYQRTITAQSVTKRMVPSPVWWTVTFNNYFWDVSRNINKMNWALVFYLWPPHSLFTQVPYFKWSKDWPPLCAQGAIKQ